MQRRQIWSTPVWPYLAVLTFLFVFAVIASKSWRLPLHSTIADNPTRPIGGAPEVPSQDPSPQLAPLSRGPTRASTDQARPFDLDTFRVAPRIVAHTPTVMRRVAPPARLVRPPVTRPIAPMSDSLGSARLVPPAAPPRMSAPGVFQLTSLASRNPASVSAWPLAREVIDRLRRFDEQPACRQWASETIGCLERLHECRSLEVEQASRELAELRRLTDQTGELQQRVTDDQLRRELVHIVNSIQRRLDVWEQVCRIVQTGRETHMVSFVTTAPVDHWIGEVEQRLASSRSREGWRRYLELEALTRAAQTPDQSQRRQIARKVLDRMESPSLKPNQRALLDKPPFSDLRQALCRWAHEPVDYCHLLNSIERFEQTESGPVAAELADAYQRLRWSGDKQVQRLADVLEQHYRQANMRVMVSAELINQALPAEVSFSEELCESIMGACVRGTNEGTARLRAVLIPDERRWRIGLEAQGDVLSDSVASRGPAVFYNTARSKYFARKLLLADQQGIHAVDAEGEATSQIAFVDCQTSFDAIPLIGWIVRSIARDELDKRAPQAQSITASRLESLATERLDEEVASTLNRTTDRVKSQFLEPLRKLELRPVALSLRTTPEHLSMDYRIAGQAQLAAHTASPTVPNRPLLHFQIHETALNNTLDQLVRHTEEKNLRQWYYEIGRHFQKSDWQVPDDVPDDVTVRFAPDDPIRLHCDDGRVCITLRFLELKRHRRRPWQCFAVRAYYAPRISTRQVLFERDGPVELAGRRLSTFDQIALRGIFSKVFSSNRPLPLIGERLADSPAMQDARIDDVRLDHGWLAVTLQSTSVVTRRITDQDEAMIER